MFRVKICGITNVEDATNSFDAGADAIGLNFYELSKRCIPGIDVAKKVADAAFERGALPVGVFVNHSYEDISRVRDATAIHSIQLHGDETPAFSKQVADDHGEVIRVIRYRSEDGIFKLQHDLLYYVTVVGYCPAGYLIDAASPGYGGAGKTLPWDELAAWNRAIAPTMPLILAGGLTPDNVAEAIRIVRPAAVDVASGVESSPGKKDAAKVRDFVANALGAFEALGGM